MNKQELANKIWESANKMRSKIEANEYKDYILGFIFYKFLSEGEVRFLIENDYDEETLPTVVEEDSETVEWIQNNIGYFIEYKNLYSTWLTMGKDFSVSNVSDALSAFNRLISPTHKKVFEGIFDTLQTGLSKLGDSTGSQTKAIISLLQLIKDIPMDDKQDYDVLGFIYEYLIGKFASNAGKKAGEFYTPHEVSELMSEIIADYLKDRETIEIYDPTSGSGSLLITIGKSVSKYIGNSDNIKYYAQELKQNTYNLTRMNLVMRGINPHNIVTRNGDTLEEDWPFFDENHEYKPLFVDAVVSNPPYSQAWDPTDKETDPRFRGYGLAPKSKADYAFLLHDLYHLKPDGIMTIVLPHGVLFRGGEEGEIRKNLIENNHIDTIIGLPANIFYGTGIPTIIMVLKKQRENNDILIIDASKGFIKEGNNNKLRSSDIKRIADTVKNREDIDKFSRKVSLDEIRRNDYNLNIPRYVDSSEENESWDIYASMFGGIPAQELNVLNDYWDTFPNLKNDLFVDSNAPYLELKDDNISDMIKNHSDIISFNNSFNYEFNDFNEYLKNSLITHVNDINISMEETDISNNIFKRLSNIPLIDKYNAYQILDDEWNKISVDIEIIQTEGYQSITQVDPNMVIKKKNGKEQEVQEGWAGHIIPFELVQSTLLKEENNSIKNKENRLQEIASTYEEIIDSLTEEEKNLPILNDANDAFVSKEINNSVKTIQAEIETPEIIVLNDYLQIKRKYDKLDYINNHPEINWHEMPINKDNTYSKTAVNNYIKTLKLKVTFKEDTLTYKIMKVSSLMEEEKQLKAEIKKDKADLELLSKETIENLNESQIEKLLEVKWIKPLNDKLKELPNEIINTLISKIEYLNKKYKTTYFDIEREIKETEDKLVDMLDELEGNEYDMKGISEFKSLLKGE